MINKLKDIINTGRVLRNFVYLKETGWWNSFRAQAPLDAENKPIPWVTYSFIDFIDTRIRNVNSLFEFGSGNSTKYYATRVGNVTALEHDRAWYDKISKDLPSNAEVVFQQLQYGGDYSKTAVSSGRTFQMIIVDGRDRVNCFTASLDALTPDGVMVLDDSERTEYAEALNRAELAGFKRIDFWGFAPGLMYKKATSVFYRSQNVLGI